LSQINYFTAGLMGRKLTTVVMNQLSCLGGVSGYKTHSWNWYITITCVHTGLCLETAHNLQVSPNIYFPLTV